MLVAADFLCSHWSGGRGGEAHLVVTLPIHVLGSYWLGGRWGLVRVGYWLGIGPGCWLGLGMILDRQGWQFWLQTWWPRLLLALSMGVLAAA